MVASEDSEGPFQLASPQPAQGEWHLLLIEGQQAHLPLSHQGNTWGQAVVVVKLLSRTELQRRPPVVARYLSGVTLAP